MDLTIDIATEEVQRQALKVLYDGLNDEISVRNAIWTPKDEDYFVSIGREAQSYQVEHIETENFYPGTVPSLINAEPGKYPNCCVFAWGATPQNSRDDLGEMYSITLNVEFMVKSDAAKELEVNARIQRTLEAAHSVIMANRSLNKTVSAIKPPSKTMGEIFAVRTKTSNRERAIWQGGVLVYSVDKYINMG